jgi:hypothetical protein
LNNIFDSNRALVSTILSGFPFPDEGEMSDERSWQPQHFTIVLGVRNKISEDDIRIMLSADPLPKQRLIKREAADMYPKCDKSGRCALHLVAQYSESLELLENILQMDHNMNEIASESEDTGLETTLLGFLCRRCHFPAFNAMVLTLTKVDSSVDGIYNVVIEHMRSYNGWLYQDISPGSTGAKSLIPIQLLQNMIILVFFIKHARTYHYYSQRMVPELKLSAMEICRFVMQHTAHAWEQ